MTSDILDTIADRFVAIGLASPKRHVRDELQAADRPLRDIMDRFTRYGLPPDAPTPVFVLDSVGRVEDYFIAKISIDGTVSAAVIRYWVGE